jgi:hypothetical protein
MLGRRLHGIVEEKSRRSGHLPIAHGEQLDHELLLVMMRGEHVALGPLRRRDALPLHNALQREAGRACGAASS